MRPSVAEGGEIEVCALVPPRVRRSALSFHNGHYRALRLGPIARTVPLRLESMLKGTLLHPQIAAALARAGHGSRVLVADGNFPHSTRRGPNAEVAFLNLSPGVITCTDALAVLVASVPLESATAMAPDRSGPYAMAEDPPIWEEFRDLLGRERDGLELEPIERFAFYEAAIQPDVALTIATADQRLFANLLLTIGVV